MQEEKKEEKKEEAPAPAVPAQAAPAQKKEPEAAKKEKPANCAACNKSLRKKRHYYRDGKYFCTKRCWKTTLKKEAKPEEAPKS